MPFECMEKFQNTKKKEKNFRKKNEIFGEENKTTREIHPFEQIENRQFVKYEKEIFSPKI